MNKISGVYKITNKVTSDFYIGSSKNIKARWANHKCTSNWSNHPGTVLYKAFSEYGLNNFLFEIIEETNNLKEREQYYIDLLKPSYNIMNANGIDIKRRKETNRKALMKWDKLHHIEKLTYQKVYNSKLCLYEGETLTLCALSTRFHRYGMANPTKEAKKYLIQV